MNSLLLLDLNLTEHLIFWKEFEFLKRNSKILQNLILLNFLFLAQSLFEHFLVRLLLWTEVWVVQLVLGLINV